MSRDIDDILREEGEDAARAYRDSARPYQPKPEVNGNGHDGASAKPRKRFTPIWLDDIDVDQEPVWLVGGIIPLGPSLGETVGPPKSLKSIFLMDLCIHIAAGKAYGERKVLQGATIYITSEGVRGVKRRAKAMRKHHEIDGKRIPFALVPVMPNLGTGTGDLEELIAHITEAMQGIAVPLRKIVIDTVRAATPGKSENDAKDMSAFLANCSKLAETFGCHVHMVHHTPRSNGERGSGTNAIDGAVDVILTVARADMDNKPRAAITIKWMKDGEEGDTWTIEMRTEVVGKEADVGDAEGKPKTGGYVTIVEQPHHSEASEDVAGSMVKKQPKLPAAAKIALDALSDALCEVGEKPPASVIHVASTVARVVTIDQWRQYAYRRGISKSDKPRAKQTAFARAAAHLQAIYRVGCLDDLYWIVPRSL
jgi:hypothetical protein